MWQLPVTRHAVSADVAGAGRTHFEVKLPGAGRSCEAAHGEAGRVCDGV